MTRTPLIVGNWKMNHGLKETQNFFSGFQIPKKAEAFDIGIAPSYTNLATAANEIRKHNLLENLLLFSQNAAHLEKGALTGEVSVGMLKEVGCVGTLLGHSERRNVFLETDTLINQKLRFCLKSDFRVILCVGETLEQREAGKTSAIVQAQLSQCLEGVTPAEMDQVAVAYEPVWAIGTGRTATSEQAEEVHRWIREFLWNRFNAERAASIRVIYGGSVTPAVTEALFQCPNVDGFLIGGASLNSQDFMSIIQLSSKTTKRVTR